MKKTRIALLTAGALVTFVATNVAATPTATTTPIGYANNAKQESNLSATVSLRNGMSGLTGIFTQSETLNARETNAQHAGNIRVSGFEYGRAYVLGEATLSGADTTGYSTRAGEGFGWTTNVETDASTPTKSVLISDVEETDAYVKIVHKPIAPLEGITTITIPVTSYTE